jgi:hypothetical protein
MADQNLADLTETLRGQLYGGDADGRGQRFTVH